MSHAKQIEALKGLLERVKAAKKSDRQLDRDICKALLPADREKNYWSWKGIQPKGSVQDPSAYWTYNAFIATAQIDAALQIASRSLPKWSVSIALSEGYQHPVVTMGRSYPTNKTVAVEHRTAPLAFCQAILEATILEAQNAPNPTPLPDSRSENTGGRGAP